MTREVAGGLEVVEVKRPAVVTTDPRLSFPPYFRGGVTPAGSGTCATFSVIDTRL